MADDGIGSEQARVGQVLDGCLAVSPQDLVELEQVLPGMDLDAHPQLVGRLPGRSQQGGATRLDLEGKQHPLQAPALRAVMPADEVLRTVEGTQPSLLVQLVGEVAVWADAVVVGLVGGAEIRPHAQFPHDGDMLLGGRPDLHDRRAAVP